MGVDGNPRFPDLLGRARYSHHIGPDRGLLPRRAEPDAIFACKRIGHLLGRIANVVAPNSTCQGAARDPVGTDTRGRFLSRLPGGHPGTARANAAYGHLALTRQLI